MGAIVGFNSQIVELGLSAFQLRRGGSRIDKFIRDLDTNFHLVLVQDLFAESLVLLSRELCMPFVNLTSLWKKERLPDYRVRDREREMRNKKVPAWRCPWDRAFQLGQG